MNPHKSKQHADFVMHFHVRVLCSEKADLCCQRITYSCMLLKYHTKERLQMHVAFLVQSRERHGWFV
jgi:hypothetical protein